MKFIAKIGSRVLGVKQFYGDEELSFGYEYKAYVYAQKFIENAVGLQISVYIDDTEFSSGIVGVWRFLYVDLEQNYHYECVFTSTLQYNLHWPKYRIYKDVSIDDILSQLCHDSTRAFRDSKKYDYLCQYNQSDFNFMRSILFSEQIQYYFRAGQVIFFDESYNIPEIIHLRLDTSESSLDADIITEWVVEHMAKPDSFTIYSTDFSKIIPPVRESGNANANYLNSKPEHGQNSDNFETKYTAKTKNPAMHAGFAISLHEQKYRITRVRHEYNGDFYKNECTCIDFAKKFAARACEKTKIHSIETATVVGSGDIDHKDGKVKVKFAWSEIPTDYIPVVQSMAGNGFGFFIIPRVGQRVCVMFEHGDPSRPIVSGAFYDNSHIPPYASKSGYRTACEDSSCEISFDDKDSTVNISTSKDMIFTIENDQKTKINRGNSETEIKYGSEKLRLSAGDNTIEIAQGNHAISISSGSIKQILGSGDIEYQIKDGAFIVKVPKMIIQASEVEIKSEEIVMNAENLTLNAGEVDLSASGSMKISANDLNIEGSLAIQIKSTKISLN